MRKIAAPSFEQDLERFIAAFEAAQYENRRADLANFLPDRDDSLYLPVLRELVRVDLEYTWAHGEARRLDHYRQTFPELFDDLQSVQAVCFEEFRLRQQAGENVSAGEYHRDYGADTQSWPVLPQDCRTKDAGFKRSYDPVPSSRPSMLSTTSTDRVNGHSPARTMPKAGETLLGFELVAELGRGAFATVFLARQGSLADRFVALKISRTRIKESGILARLQHTNIVPVFSVHWDGPFQVLCMPFYGSTTLADVIRDMRARQGLPSTGKTLVETLCSRASGADWKDRVPNPEMEITSAAKCGVSVQSADNASSFSLAGVGTCLRTFSGLTYADAVMWIGSRLAEGLHHAHQRGILHRDLKPANVLLADDGQPMLLDFNLSEDVRPGADAAAEFIGGTLPYMAPESLLAYQRGERAGDARSDVYSLGVILYELLTGRLPLSAYRGREQEVLSLIPADHHVSAPGLRDWNTSVSPATEAIVQKCLAADPGRRYASADDLRDDLERQLKHRPLRHAPEPSLRERARKWVRRHPRLTSASSVAMVAGLLVALLVSGLAYRGARLARLEATENLAQFQNDLQAAQTKILDFPIGGQSGLKATWEACQRALGRFGVFEYPAWQDASQFKSLSPDERAKIREDVGELLLLMAAIESKMSDVTGPSSPPDGNFHLGRAVYLNRRAEQCFAPEAVPKAVWQQRAEFADRQGMTDEAREDRARAAARRPSTTRDYAMAAYLLMSQRRFRAALPLWQNATSHDPKNVWAWYGLGRCYDQLAQSAQAAACYTACIALKPDFHGWYFNRGLVYLKQKDYALATSNFDDVLRLQPDQVVARFNRAVAELGENRCSQAIADLEEVINQGGDAARVRFLLAHALEKAGDTAGAEAARRAGMQCAPTDDAAWVSRAVAHAKNDPAAALDDLDRALQCNAFCLPALESKANLLAERLGRTEEAIRVLDRAVATDPENGSLLAARGVLSARLARSQDARRDAQAVLSLDHSAPTTYQVAGIYALLSREESADFDRAIVLLASALRSGYGEDLIATDKDLDPIRRRPQFQQLVQAMRTLHPASAELLSRTARSASAD